MVRRCLCVGGFAFANRNGRIEFRQFAAEPCLEISANRRFDAQISEYTCGLAGVEYTDKYENTVSVAGQSSIEIGNVVQFSNSNYFHDTTESDYVEVYTPWLTAIAEKFDDVVWNPGQISYYGNPALDLGDMVEVSGGIVGESVKFLICAETWQFRAPQTLISAGPSENRKSTEGSSGGSGTASFQTSSITVTKVINTVHLDTDTGALYQAERTVASGTYSCKSQTSCFAAVNAVLHADENTTVYMSVYHDDIVQEFRPITTVSEGSCITCSFTLPLLSGSGTHTISVRAVGENADVQSISAYVYGQEISEETPQHTDENDYIFTVSNGLATVTGYIGNSMYPEIPNRLGSGVTTIIDDSAFTDSEITAVYIPEGVTEIR